MWLAFSSVKPAEKSTRLGISVLPHRRCECVIFTCPVIL